MWVENHRPITNETFEYWILTIDLSLQFPQCRDKITVYNNKDLWLTPQQFDVDIDFHFILSTWTMTLWYY